MNVDVSPEDMMEFMKQVIETRLNVFLFDETMHLYETGIAFDVVDLFKAFNKPLSLGTREMKILAYTKQGLHELWKELILARMNPLYWNQKDCNITYHYYTEYKRLLNEDD